jgi:hypothetical protein
MPAYIPSFSQSEHSPLVPTKVGMNVRSVFFLKTGKAIPGVKLHARQHNAATVVPAEAGTHG